jgi:hypothetical protein
VGLSGELAMQSMSKGQRKKYLEAKKQEEEEQRHLKERILKANQDRDMQVKQQAIDEKK